VSYVTILMCYVSLNINSDCIIAILQLIPNDELCLPIITIVHIVLTYYSLLFVQKH